jgi:hypothetical protein
VGDAVGRVLLHTGAAWEAVEKLTPAERAERAELRATIDAQCEETQLKVGRGSRWEDGHPFLGR